MKKTISRALISLTLCSTIFAQSCASLAGPSVLELPPSPENREYKVSLDKPGFEYQWFKCSRRFFGICTKHEKVVEFLDWTKPEVRKQFSDMGMVLKMRERR